MADNIDFHLDFDQIKYILRGKEIVMVPFTVWAKWYQTPERLLKRQSVMPKSRRCF